MPSKVASATEPPATVVVTGANGFIAQHCIAALLGEGYRVVGTVRTAAKAERVRRTHGGHAGLEVVVVADLTAAAGLAAAGLGAALGGAPGPSAVLHLAAPFRYDAADYEGELMRPAVGGATAVLEAAAAAGSVRRVVMTGSFASIYDAAAGPGRTYTAGDWSPLTYDDGVRAPDAPTAYRASKTAAERAAWGFVAARRPAWDLVSLCPAMVFGPWLAGAAPRSPADVNTSNALVRAVVAARDGLPPTRAPAWVDVRDVAAAHVAALRVPAAGGRRFLLSAGVYCNQELADVARRVAGKHAARIPEGEPGRREAPGFAVDARDAERVLGLRWRGLDECLRALVPQLLAVDGACA